MADPAYEVACTDRDIAAFDAEEPLGVQIHWIAIMAPGDYALSSAVDYYCTPNLAWLRKHLPTCEIEHDFLRTAPNGIDPHFAVNALDLRPG